MARQIFPPGRGAGVGHAACLKAQKTICERICGFVGLGWKKQLCIEAWSASLSFPSSDLTHVMGCDTGNGGDATCWPVFGLHRPYQNADHTHTTYGRKANKYMSVVALQRI